MVLDDIAREAIARHFGALGTDAALSFLGRSLFQILLVCAQANQLRQQLAANRVTFKVEEGVSGQDVSFRLNVVAVERPEGTPRAIVQLPGNADGTDLLRSRRFLPDWGQQCDPKDYGQHVQTQVQKCFSTTTPPGPWVHYHREKLTQRLELQLDDTVVWIREDPRYVEFANGTDALTFLLGVVADYNLRRRSRGKVMRIRIAGYDNERLLKYFEARVQDIYELFKDVVHDTEVQMLIPWNGAGQFTERLKGSATVLKKLKAECNCTLAVRVWAQPTTWTGTLVSFFDGPAVDAVFFSPRHSTDAVTVEGLGQTRVPYEFIEFGASLDDRLPYTRMLQSGLLHGFQQIWTSPGTVELYPASVDEAAWARCLRAWEWRDEVSRYIRESDPRELVSKGRTVAKGSRPAEPVRPDGRRAR
ncbi:MAG: hypothetical protein Q8M65_09530 [Rhodoglobus sp.]|nr:hypothetical protein [Rhodoglobus sp.]